MVSVVIPVHNRADRIGAAIQSVLNQTVSDLEVIVVDDGSTDGTREAVAQLHDPRLKYVYQEHAGACAARNAGVSLAQGEWAAFQDSDDLWQPRKLEKQFRRLAETQADVICCRMARREKDGTVSLFPAGMKEGFQTLAASLLGVGTQTLLGKREVFEAYPFDPAMPRLQEFEWLCRVRQEYTVYFLDEILVEYRPENDALSADPEKLAAACALLGEKHPGLRSASPKTAAQLAGRLRLDAEAAALQGHPAYKDCLRQAAVWGGKREKRLLRLDGLGLFPAYARARQRALTQRRDHTLLWRAVTCPLRAAKRVKRTAEELLDAEPIRNHAANRRHFGKWTAGKLALCKTIDILSGYHTALYHGCVRRFCKEAAARAAQETEALPKGETAHPGPIPVWTLWWEGEAAAPPIVRMCLESQRRFFPAPDYAFHVLDQHTYADFAPLEPGILEQLLCGRITLTHLSDILRAELLKTHGGLWLDATVYLTGPLDKNDLSGAFYTNRKTAYPRNLRRLVSAGRWTGYFMQTEPGSEITVFLSHFFRLYWQRHDALIDYYLIDYAIDAAYRLLPEARRRIDGVPLNNPRVFDLFDRRNEAYQAPWMDALLRENAIHKLSLKYPCRDTDGEGRMTVWRWLREENAHEI